MDNFCGYCGCPMKVEDRLMEAAATGNRLPVTDGQFPSVAETNALSALAEAVDRSAKTVPAPRVPKISMGMFK